MKFGEYLHTEFEKRKTRNPRYSLRAFAKHLGIEPGALSRIVNGKTDPLPATILKVLPHLELMPEDQEKLLIQFIGAPPSAEHEEPLNLSPDQIAIMNRWEYSAIRTLIRTRHRFSDAKQVAKHLGIAVWVARDCLEMLQRQGLIAWKEDHWIVSGRRTLVKPNTNPNVMKILHEYIDLALQAKKGPEADLAAFSGLTVETDPSRLEAAIVKIREFRNMMEEFLPKGNPTRVFRLNVQLFPIDKKPE